MLIIQRIGKHCNCHLQGERVLVGRFWKPYMGRLIPENRIFTLKFSRENLRTRICKVERFDNHTFFSAEIFPNF
jgi:hypothetical protein